MKLSTASLILLAAAALATFGGCMKPMELPLGTVAREVGSPAPAWRLKDINGQNVSSYAFKGKVVVVDFWATWCPPCIQEIPVYVSLQKKYEKEGLVFVGMSVDEGGTSIVKKFMAKNEMNYPVVMADAGIRAAFGDLEALPTTFVIDREGKIRHKKIGAGDMAEFEKVLGSLLK